MSEIDEKIITDEPKEPEIIEGEPGDVIVKDDELYVIEEPEEDSEKSKDKTDEPSGEGEEPAEEAGKSKEAGEGGDEPKPKVEEEEVSKSDIKLKILEKKIEEQDKLISEMNLTPEQLLARTPLADLEKDLPNQKAILANIDPDLNPTEHAKQLQIVSTLEANISTKREADKLNERFNSKDNKAFLDNERKKLSDNGFDFSDKEWETIGKVAENYLDDGKYNEDSIQKGLVDILGSDVVTKMYKVSGEQKARTDIKKAAAKETKSVKITSSGKSGKIVSFAEKIANMEPDAMEAALDALTPEQYSIYKKQLKRLQKK